MGKEQRRYPRIPVRGDSIVELGGRHHPGEVVSLSIGGAFIRFLSRPPMCAATQPARLTLLSDGQAIPSLEVGGAIVYVEGDGVGISFDQPEQLLMWAHYYEEDGADPETEPPTTAT